MKVLLVRPISKKMPIIMPNLGLGYLATALRKDSHEVQILDCVKENYDYQDFAHYLKDFKPDVVGIQLFTCDFTAVKKMLKVVKLFNSNILTMIGGPHVSGASKLTLQNIKDADFAFVSEAEIGIRQLLNKKDDLAKVAGLVYRSGEEIIVNPAVRIDNLDEFDFPAWDLMVPKTYPIAPHGSFVKQIPVAPIITTRGCPYQCTYCAAGVNAGKKLRKRNIDNVIKEIKLLVNKYNVKEIHIEDDNFTLDKMYVTEFCNKLISENLNLIWACPNGVRLDTLDSELVQLMEKAGCYSFAVGIESGSPRILKDMKRIVTVEKMIEKIKLIRDHTNIRISGFFILGYPGETKEDFYMTMDLAYKLPIQRAQFGNFLPLPGTEIFQRLVDQGEIDMNKLNWDEYLTHQVVYSPKNISSKELTKITKQARWKFYFRPQIIWGLLKEIHSLEHALIIFRRAVDNLI